MMPGTPHHGHSQSFNANDSISSAHSSATKSSKGSA